jgi:hypothetical protein
MVMLVYDETQAKLEAEAVASTPTMHTSYFRFGM